MFSSSSLRRWHDEPFPLLGGRREGPGFHLILTAENPDLRGMDLSDQRVFQAYLDQKFGARYTWGVSGYLEYREAFLKHLPQMQNEKRYYHLGLDVLAPVLSPLFTPFEAIVADTGYDEGKGNYGAWALLQHTVAGQRLYTFYGHLDPDSLPEKNANLRRGDMFGHLGDFPCNGDWFHHVHVQVLTEKGLAEGFLNRGYCREDELEGIAERCPSPLFVFR